MKRIFIIICILVGASNLLAAPAQNDNQPANASKMQWWKDAKFGMFIHWGIYSVPAGEWKDSRNHGEWIMNTGKIPCNTYAQFAKKFNPVKFNAEEWVKLAKAAGQKYIVITSKHHDGFAMFHSKASRYNVYDATPFHRDVLAELAEACRKHDMKLGFYYSQAQDWHHPGGAVAGGEWDASHKGDMMKYIKQVALPQVKELLANYGDVAVFWWDTPVGMTEEMARIVSEPLKDYPQIITNNRLGAGFGGDLETPEQFIPATGFPGRNWEVCMTMNDIWGYSAYNERWKPVPDLIRKLVDIVSKGGNFLLNVGPTSEGVIPMVCQDALHEMGAWLQVNGDAIYGSSPSPFTYLPWGRATRKGQTVYLHVFDWPADCTLRVPLLNKVTSAYMMADKDTPLKVEQVEGGTLVSLPRYAPDKVASVVALTIEGEPSIAPVPSVGASVKVVDAQDQDAKAADQLVDGNYSTRWTSTGHHATFQIELKQPAKVQYVQFTTPWNPWEGVEQHAVLQAQVGGNWETLFDGNLPGDGATEAFQPVEAQHFRLVFDNEKKPLAIQEVSLFQADPARVEPKVDNPDMLRGDYWNVAGWTNMLQQMDLHVDAAFLGNSIIYGGDFQPHFPSKVICNLGYPGNDIQGLIRRVPQVVAVHPKQVYVMGGINGMGYWPVEKFTSQYNMLVDSIQRSVPQAEVYLLSVLPVSSWQDRCTNADIEEANDALKQIAIDHHCTYIDLYSLYLKDGELNPAYRRDDGLHLTPEGYAPWIEAIRPYIDKK